MSHNGEESKNFVRWEMNGNIGINLNLKKRRHRKEGGCDSYLQWLNKLDPKE